MTTRGGRNRLPNHRLAPPSWRMRSAYARRTTKVPRRRLLFTHTRTSRLCAKIEGLKSSFCFWPDRIQAAKRPTDCSVLPAIQSETAAHVWSGDIEHKSSCCRHTNRSLIIYLQFRATTTNATEAEFSELEAQFERDLLEVDRTVFSDPDNFWDMIVEDLEYQLSADD